MPYSKAGFVALVLGIIRDSVKFILVVVLLICSCDTLDENLKSCFPVRMSANIISGTDTYNLTADFKYIPETDVLDHITWSNRQTRYYEYDESGILKVIKLKKIDPKIQEETWFRYEGDRLVRLDLCIKHLDIIYLEPIEGDSAFTGYHLFDYAGDRISQEKIFEVEKTKKETLVIEKDYNYDAIGNMTHYNMINLITKAEESMSMAYGPGLHPYSQLNMYFDGETHINNVLTKTSETENLEYTYEIVLDNNRYPEEIIEKTNGMVSRVTMYTYYCK